MKINLPVTDIETLLPEGEFIYSRTDLKGVITEANEAFCSVSAYTREEMLGKSHNIVRHPDMPPAAFEDLWRDLKTGRPWRGLVKNRRKDGGFYWVVANVSPVREDGHVVGYQSVRSRPSREEIAAASAAYARIAKGDTSIYVEHGRVVRRRPAIVNTLVSLRSQMTLAALAGLIPSAILLASGKNHAITIIAAAALVCSLWFLLYYSPRVVRDLAHTDGWLEQLLSTGDLRIRHDLSRRDLLGAIVRKTDTLVSSVQASLQGMDDVAGQVERATKDVENGIADIHRSAKVQSEATSSSAAAIEEVTVSIGEVASQAQTTHATAAAAGIAARDGTSITEDASRMIESLAGTVRAAAEQVESLGKRTEEISRITGVIRAIADQTNLLALNAAIEAARSGDQGRGFAVVADEVRKLAERTGQATQEISEMLQSIHAETQTAVAGMREGASQVAEGVDLVNKAAGSLTRINEEMTCTTGMVGEISHASDEQRSAMTELARNVERVASMTEQNVAAVSQITVTADYLDGIVDRLHKAVRQYRY